MSPELLVDPSFDVPSLYETPRFVLVPLHPSLNELHYEAWKSSARDLKNLFGPDQPFQSRTLTENLENLNHHYESFQNRSAFSYAALDPHSRQCLGCVYILPSPVVDYQCQVYFWVRSNQKPKGLEEFLYMSLKEWLLQRWPFRTSEVAFPGREISWKEWKLSQRK